MGFLTRRGAALLALALVAGACDLTQGPDDKPTRAEIQVEGTAPNPLKLITSINFAETFDTRTLQYGAVLVESDTLEISLPYSGTVNLDALGSVYVEVLQPEEATATVRLRVNLDNGESSDQSGTLSNFASFIYYFAFFES